MKIRKGFKKIRLAMGLSIMMLLSLVGCGETISENVIDINFSTYSGVKEKEIFLNSDVNSLNMDGTISMKSGNVVLYVKVQGTNEILYSREYTSANNGSISVDIDDLDGNRDLIFGLQANKAEKFKLYLTSQQKLIRDKEITGVSKPDKPSL